jgi:hypothetical protein
VVYVNPAQKGALVHETIHGSLFTQGHFYLVFYSKYANNILVYAAAIDFL